MTKDNEANDFQSIIDYLKEHVQYEYDMLNLTLDYMHVLQEPERKLSDPMGRVVNNALIESFLIHFRALYDFFELPRLDKNNKPIIIKHKKDDVVASKYVKNWSEIISEDSSNIMKDSSNIMIKCRNRIDKEIAHITDKRLSDPSKKQWPFIEMEQEIRKYIDLFNKEAAKLELFA